MKRSTDVPPIERPEIHLNGRNAADALAHFDCNGVLLARRVLNVNALTSVRCWADAWGAVNEVRIVAGDTDIELEYWRSGGGNLQHACELNGIGFCAPIVPLLVFSPLWPVIEAIIGSTDLVVPLHYFRLRRMQDFPPALNEDRPELIAGNIHQDAAAVHPDLPLTIWLPLQDVPLGSASSIGFAQGKFEYALPAPITADVVEAEIHDFWKPAFDLGDAVLFSRYTPHATVRYGTNAERYSCDLRLSSIADLPPGLTEQVQIRRTGDSFEFSLLGQRGMAYLRTFALMLEQDGLDLPRPPDRADGR